MSYHMVLPYCVALIKDKNGKILVGQHNLSERKPYPGYWDLPGGKLEDGETPEECIVREVKEELGVAVTKLRLYRLFHHDRQRRLDTCTNDICGLGMCFICEIEGEIVPTEQNNVHYATLEEISSLSLTPWCRHFVNASILH